MQWVNNMSDNTTIEVNKKLIAMLDGLLGGCNWESSLFLKTASKKFLALRMEAEQLLLASTAPDVTQKAVMQVKEGHAKVFISMYQMEGNNLQKWYVTLKSLDEYSISRPVYREEEHIRAMVRAKPDAQREAYVAIFVKNENIINLPPGRIATDKLGNELLTLKTGAVKLDNIIEFVHGEQRYQINETGLVLKTEE